MQKTRRNWGWSSLYIYDDRSGVWKFRYEVRYWNMSPMQVHSRAMKLQELLMKGAPHQIIVRTEPLQGVPIEDINPQQVLPFKPF